MYKIKFHVYFNNTDRRLSKKMEQTVDQTLAMNELLASRDE